MELSLNLYEDIESRLENSTLLDCPGLEFYITEPEIAYDGMSRSTKDIVLLSWTLMCTGIDAGIILVYLLLWSNQSCYGWCTISMVSSFLCYNAAMATFVFLRWALAAGKLTLSIYNRLCIMASTACILPVSCSIMLRKSSDYYLQPAFTFQ